LHVYLLLDFRVVVLSIKWNVIILITKLEESFSSCRGMFWSLSIVSMWQEDSKSVFHIPFGLSRYKELVDNDLSAINEVTELGFPQTERVGVCLSVP